MSFYGGNQNGGQPGSQQQQLARQANPGLQNVQQVLTPQLFNINVNPNQLHSNFFNEHNASQAPLQLNAAAAAAANAPSLLLQTQQTQSFPVNLINEQLGVGVSQLISPAAVSQSQMQGLPISMPSALSFPQTIQVHAATPASQSNQPQSQQSKQRVFTGTVTKIHDNFGFIDEEVFFQMGVVKGPILPKEGDRVLVEANFNANMPFKWNASRVQIVNIGGGLSSMSSMNANQNQHMAYSNQKPFAPPPPVLSSQANPIRQHGAQPVTIVSNPHSVYSGAAGNQRGRVNAPVALPTPTSHHTPHNRGDPPKGNMGMPIQDPPPFMSQSVSSGINSSDRDRDMDRDRGRESERSRERDNTRDHSKERSRDRDRMRPHSRERSRERTCDRSRDKVLRPRSRTPERKPRVGSPDRSRERKVMGSSRDRSRDRNLRERDSDRSRDRHDTTRMRSRSPRDRSRDRHREKSPEKDKVKRDRTPDRFRERSSREQGRNDKEDRKPQRKNSTSPSSKSSKEDLKRDASKTKEKDKPSVDKARPRRERSPVVPAAGAQPNLDRARRSRSRESVRTEKGQLQERERSRSRSGSPKRRTATRPSPRYAVELPKFSLDMRDINAKELQRRYPNLYVPSDFFLAKSTWMDTFPMHSPFELGKACPVQIMRKGVHKIEIPDPDGFADKFANVPDLWEPVDASYTFKAKVMIPSMSSLDTLYRKACGLGEDESHVSDSFQHVDRLISFVVGMKTAKHEVMAIGGPWSPSLDGANPHSDPYTLINTAVRSVRALTGINLSRCKNWYRFMELYYKRGSCLETVVFYLPDVWSSVPGAMEWGKLKSLYKQALCGEDADSAELKVEKINSTKDMNNASSTSNNVSSKSETQTVSVVGESPALVSGKESGTSGSDCTGVVPLVADNGKETGLQEDDLLVIDEAASPTRDDSATEDQLREDVDGSTILVEGVIGDNATCDGGVNPMEDATPIESSWVGAGNAEDAGIESKPSDRKTNEGRIETNDVVDDFESQCIYSGTHFSLLTPSKMTVVQLKEELSLRKLSPKGLKSQLMQRLVAAMKEDETRESEKQKSQEALDSAKPVDVIQEDHNKELGTNTQSDVVAADEMLNKEAENEQAEVHLEDQEPSIRLVNPSLILEDVDDEISMHDDDVSIDDGELKANAKCVKGDFSADAIFAKFPPNTFPILKPEMKEEEVKMWERRYSLPKNPRLLIYPSASAKNGNFDCVTMTLALLRDYRIIDKKEDTFEVSLFSELFHEMMQRDFAFRIFQEIVTEAGNGKVNVEDTTSEKDDKSDKDSAGEPTSKRIKLSDTNNSISTAQKKKTADPFLLLSFVFFDVTRCGYITDSDLEDICNCIGVGLTRAQIRKLVQKCVHKGTLHYRQWTDKVEKSKPRTEEELRILAKGNKCHFPVFITNNETKLKSGEGEEDLETIVAVVDGQSVDVKKLLTQLHNYERDLAVAESNLNVVKNSLNEAKAQVSDLKKSNESFKDELGKTKEALKKSETSEKAAKDDVELFKRSSERFVDRIKDMIKFPTSSCKEKSDVSSKEAGRIKEKSNSTDTKEKAKLNQEPIQLEVGDQSSSPNGKSAQSSCEEGTS